MSGKVFSITVVIIAVLIGILVCVVPMTSIMSVLLVMKFFQAMIPVLGVGALLKYILCGNSCPTCSTDKCK
jgi:hypothetical protein